MTNDSIHVCLSCASLPHLPPPPRPPTPHPGYTLYVARCDSGRVCATPTAACLRIRTGRTHTHVVHSTRATVIVTRYDQSNQLMIQLPNCLGDTCNDRVTPFLHFNQISQARSRDVSYLCHRLIMLKCFYLFWLFWSIASYRGQYLIWKFIQILSSHYRRKPFQEIHHLLLCCFI